MPGFYVEIKIDDNNMAAYEEIENSKVDIIRSNENTRFQLCSPRCWRKGHYGTFVDNTFTCNWFNLPPDQRGNPLGRMLQEIGQTLEAERSD